MKSQFVCFLFLASVFLSCDKNEDLMIHKDDSLVLLRQEDKGGVMVNGGYAMSRDTCMDLTIVQWLSGTGVLQPILEMAEQEASASDLPSRRIFLEANGDAMSESLARGFSELKMIYHTNPHRVTGVLLTRFYYGEVLELEFEGISHLQYEGQMLHVDVDVKEAILRTGTELYMLDEGVLRFSMPRNPEGPQSLTIEVNIKICG